ncbi:MAG: hypothetical protein WAW96_04590 [Alphaproteobacteria bacterium]
MRTIKRQLMEDRLFLWHARASQKPHFHGGTRSPPLSSHLEALEFELPKLTKPGRVSFKVSTLAGDVTAAIHVHALGAPGSPVLIYHHDTNEFPPTRTLRAMFPAGWNSGLTIYLVEAPFHDARSSTQFATNSVMLHLTMQAVAISVTERLLLSPSVARASIRVVAGFGQGGFIANRHHMMFDSATAYIPFMAGTAEAEPYLSRVPTAKRALRDRGALRALLNFSEAWAERGHRNVFPVLGSADLVNPFDAEMRSYGKTEIEVWALSHQAAKNSPERMRKKILRHIADLQAERGAALEEPAPQRRAFRGRS